MSPQKLKVSQVARIAGVGSDSIRHYERIGILAQSGAFSERVPHVERA
jgi:DNA-binding transcriptional MerR regulator